MKFGDTLRSLIEDNDKTQKEVATDLNIAPTTLGNYIRNLREPDFKTLVALANYFNISTDFLLNNYNEKGFSQEEQRLLNVFSKLSDEKKAALIDIAKILSKH